MTQTTNQNCPRILLAEDSDDDAYFFERSIKKSGALCTFVRAGNGKVATEILQQSANEGGTIDLVFLDLKMPVMTGFDVLEWLRSANLAKPPTVHVLSGSNDHTDRVRALQLGAADYIVKPISASDLRDRINSTKTGAGP